MRRTSGAKDVDVVYVRARDNALERLKQEHLVIAEGRMLDHWLLAELVSSVRSVEYALVKMMAKRKRRKVVLLPEKVAPLPKKVKRRTKRRRHVRYR